MFEDLSVFFHVLSVIIGFGSAFVADMYVFKSRNDIITPNHLHITEFFHRIVNFSLILLWTSGLLMVYIRTQIDPTYLSAKLFGKFIVVAVLTLNANFIGSHALSYMRNQIGKKLLHGSFFKQLLLITAVSISSASWLMALGFGTVEFFKTLAVEEIITYIVYFYGMSISSSIVLLLLFTVYRVIKFLSIYIIGKKEN